MFSKRPKTYLQKIIGGLFLAGLFGASLAGCKNHSTEAAKAESARLTAQQLADAKVTPVAMGKPFLLNGCMVQLTRVTVDDVPGPNYANSLELSIATADCETAKVTATHESCGKGCESDALRVEPKVREAIADAVPPKDTNKPAPSDAPPKLTSK